MTNDPYWQGPRGLPAGTPGPEVRSTEPRTRPADGQGRWLRRRDADGRFSGPRVNVEQVPRLPTFPARWVLEDPRQRAYLVFWVSEDGGTFYALKMAPTERPDSVVVTFEKGLAQRLRIVRRPLPRGTGTAFFYRCPCCQKPRRYLYRLTLSGTTLVDYGGLRCQVWARLRFGSQLSGP